jgi:hypothetical protein
MEVSLGMLDPLLLLASALLFQAQKPVLDVGAAAEIAATQNITVRGTGGFSGAKELILFDYTCPLGEGNGFVLPTVILIPSVAATPDAERAVSETSDSRVY